MVAWSTSGCVGSFLYLWDTGVYHFLEEYHARGRGHSDLAGCPLSPVAVIKSIQIKDIWHELRVYRYKHVRDKSSGAPREGVGDDLNGVYDGYLDDDEWEMPDIHSTPRRFVAIRVREIREFFPRIQQARREANGNVPQTLMKVLSIVAEWPVFAPPLEAT